MIIKLHLGASTKVLSIETYDPVSIKTNTKTVRLVKTLIITGSLHEKETCEHLMYGKDSDMTALMSI